MGQALIYLFNLSVMTIVSWCIFRHTVNPVIDLQPNVVV